MQGIRDSFQTDLDDLLLLAQGLLVLTGFGKDVINKSLGLSPDLDPYLLVPEPYLFKTNSEARDLLEVLNIYTKHQTAVQEMIHGQFVQKWLDFLDRMFGQILDGHLSGRASYPDLSGSIELKLDLLDLSAILGPNLIPIIQESALRWFNFLKPEDKLKKIKKALKVASDETLERAVKKHILVRNLFQHNNGVLRQDDIDRLGLKAITLLDDFNKPIEFKVGERLIVSFCELNAVRDDLYKMASLLIK
jgi:hypothetical protein